MRQIGDPLAIALLACAIAIGLLAISQSHETGTAAEWAGAVFSGLAVGAAVWIASRSQRAESDRNLARAIVCAHKLEPYVFAVRYRISEIRAYVDTRNAGLEDYGQFGMEQKIKEGLILEAFIPDELFVDAWALPPQVAKACIQLQAKIRDYQEMTDQAWLRMYDPDFLAISTWIKNVHLVSFQIEDLSENALAGLRALTRS